MFFFKQKTAYEMRISDWSSDVCSSDLPLDGVAPNFRERCNVIGKFMRGCRKERSPAGRPDNNAGHAEWSLHPHAHRTAVGTEKHSVGTALPNAGFHLNGAITALPNSDKGIFAEHLIRRLRIVRHIV